MGNMGGIIGVATQRRALHGTTIVPLSASQRNRGVMMRRPVAHRGRPSGHDVAGMATYSRWCQKGQQLDGR